MSIRLISKRDTLGRGCPRFALFIAYVLNQSPLTLYAVRLAGAVNGVVRSHEGAEGYSCG